MRRKSGTQKRATEKEAYACGETRQARLLKKKDGRQPAVSVQAELLQLELVRAGARR